MPPNQFQLIAATTPGTRAHLLQVRVRHRVDDAGLVVGRDARVRRDRRSGTRRGPRASCAGCTPARSRARSPPPVSSERSLLRPRLRRTSGRYFTATPPAPRAAPPGRVSSRRPLSRWITSSTHFSARGSWVTITTVLPKSRFSVCRSDRISSAFFASRSPVGSSATIELGVGHDRARDRHALLLAAGELARQVRRRAPRGRPRAAPSRARCGARRARAW